MNTFLLKTGEFDPPPESFGSFKHKKRLKSPKKILHFLNFYGDFTIKMEKSDYKKVARSMLMVCHGNFNSKHGTTPIAVQIII